MEDRQVHPIPQDVTGFQFKIIGDITVRQFAYLASSAFLIWIFFQLPISILIKLPIAILLGGVGASLAFLPIAGRPMDTMMANFIKALLNSTIYVYQKKGNRILVPTVPLGLQKPKVQKEETQEIKLPTPQISLPSTNLVWSKPKEKNEEALGLEKQLQLVLTQKEQLTKHLITLQQKLDLQKKRFFTPTMAKAPSDVAKVKTQTQNVRQIPKDMGKSVGLPIAPESSNIITGIIKDPRNNPLANILVEVKDNEDNPVRAFKTNGLGQFASATPLVNGAYTISFEDPKGQNKFDAIGFEAKGSVILPIEVISIDTREELRRSLFGES